MSTGRGSERQLSWRRESLQTRSGTVTLGSRGTECQPLERLSPSLAQKWPGPFPSMGEQLRSEHPGQHPGDPPQTHYAAEDPKPRTFMREGGPGVTRTFLAAQRDRRLQKITFYLDTTF